MGGDSNSKPEATARECLVWPVRSFSYHQEFSGAVKAGDLLQVGVNAQNASAMWRE